MGVNSDIEIKISDIEDLVSISIELNDNDELQNQGTALAQLNAEIDSLETKKYFSKKNDTNNSYNNRRAKVKSKNVCFDFQKGTCKRGDSCRFQHNKSEQDIKCCLVFRTVCRSSFIP